MSLVLTIVRNLKNKPDRGLLDDFFENGFVVVKQSLKGELYLLKVES